MKKIFCLFVVVGIFVFMGMGTASAFDSGDAQFLGTLSGSTFAGVFVGTKGALMLMAGTVSVPVGLAMMVACPVISLGIPNLFYDSIHGRSPVNKLKDYLKIPL